MPKLALDPYIAEVLMRDLVGHDKRPAAFALYFYLWWRTASTGTARLRISLRKLADETGLSKRAIQTNRRLLVRRKLIEVTRAGKTAEPEYKVLSPWIRNRPASVR
ncbi:MAG: helix-turn-helix domain-containing protein [Candidatus Solibacter usitatus]|nr:helix-turn-helix domain-containing protein [Candidatus Solibacter usitatus]